MKKQHIPLQFSYVAKIKNDRFNLEIEVGAQTPELKKGDHLFTPEGAYIAGHKDGFKAGFDRGCAEADAQILSALEKILDFSTELRKYLELSGFAE